MSSWVAALIGAGGSALLGLIPGLLLLSVNRANATKIHDEAGKERAETAEIFNRLAGEWTTRAAKANEKLEGRISELISALENLTDAVDRVTPLLEAASESPETSERVHVLRLANRGARRAIG